MIIQLESWYVARLLCAQLWVSAIVVGAQSVFYFLFLDLTAFSFTMPSQLWILFFPLAFPRASPNLGFSSSRHCLSQGIAVPRRKTSSLAARHYISPPNAVLRRALPTLAAIYEGRHFAEGKLKFQEVREGKREEKKSKIDWAPATMVSTHGRAQSRRTT